MDPLSIITGVVNIAGAACSASQALFKLVDDIKGGPEQIHAISRDAHAFYSVIISLHLALQDDSIRSIVSDDTSLVQMIDNLSRPLSNCQIVLGQLMVKIEARVKPASDGTGFRMSKRDLRWGIYAKNEVKDLMTRLEATKSTLDNALGAVHTICSIRLLSMGRGRAARALRRSTGSTDAGHALRRYVEESISSGSVLYHSRPASISSFATIKRDGNILAPTNKSSTSENKAVKQRDTGEPGTSEAFLESPDEEMVCPIESPASGTTVEQPSQTPVSMVSFDIGADELIRDPAPADPFPGSIMAGLADETLEAITTANNHLSWIAASRTPGECHTVKDELDTRDAEADLQVGPEELQAAFQAASNFQIIAPATVPFAPINDDTLTNTTMIELSSNRLLTPDPRLSRSIADHARSLEDHADPQLPTAAFLSPITFNTPIDILAAPLQLAVRYGQDVPIRTLLDAGADPNARDVESGRTALEAASLVAPYPVKVADILHQRGANVNQTDDEGWTLLHHATFRGRIGEVKWLLQKEAHLEKISTGIRTIGGAILSFVTPLQIAASSRSTDSLSCLHELLQAGARVETSADGGYTAIHLAARRGSHHAVEMLLEAGAQLDNSNNLTHETPILEAIGHQQLDVVKYLLSLDAECVRHQLTFGSTGFKLANTLRQVEVGPKFSIEQKRVRVKIYGLIFEEALKGPRNMLCYYSSDAIDINMHQHLPAKIHTYL